MSHTRVGGEFDNSMIGLIIFVAYQAIIHRLGATSNLLLGLSDKPRSDARDLLNTVSKMPLHLDPMKWREKMVNDYEPQFPMQYWYTFAAFVAIILALSTPRWVAEPFGNMLSDIMKLKSSHRSVYNFVFVNYLPAAYKAAENFHVNFFNCVHIFVSLIGACSKNIWAFVWEEDIFPVK